MLGKGTQSHILQKNQPLVMPRCGGATSIALLMISRAWGAGLR